MKCNHCKGELTNRLVVMADDTIRCYTCGRLEADKSGRREDETEEELWKRKDYYTKLNNLMGWRDHD